LIAELKKYGHCEERSDAAIYRFSKPELNIHEIATPIRWRELSRNDVCFLIKYQSLRGVERRLKQSHHRLVIARSLRRSNLNRKHAGAEYSKSGLTVRFNIHEIAALPTVARNDSVVGWTCGLPRYTINRKKLGNRSK